MALADSFEGMRIDPGRWEPWGDGGAEVHATGTVLEVTWPGGGQMHAGVFSRDAMTLAGCAVSVEVVRVPTAPDTQAFFYVGEPMARVGMRAASGQLFLVATRCERRCFAPTSSGSSGPAAGQA